MFCESTSPNKYYEEIFMKRIFVLSVLFLMSISGASFAENNTILVKMKDGKVITMSDFNRIIGYYDEEKQKVLAQNPPFKATILQRIVQGLVISKIARDKEFEKRAEIREQLELLTDDLLASEYIKKEVVAKISVPEDDMKLFYKAHQEDFKAPEMVRARHILIKVDKSASGDDKKKAKDKAEGILKRIKSGEDFAKLASEFSDDPGSKTKGGDLGLFQRGKMVPAFEEVAFSLNAGEVSDVVETRFGFHLIKVEEKKEAAIEPYDKVKEKIGEKVRAEFKEARVAEFFEEAMKDAGVEMNLEPFLPKQ
jgi:peptidyl-prolyl cis-trans isomerase C